MSDYQSVVEKHFITARIDSHGTKRGTGLEVLVGCKFYIAVTFLEEPQYVVWYLGMSDVHDAATRVISHINTAKRQGATSLFAKALEEAPNTKWVIMGLNLINTSELELFTALQDAVWGNLQSTVVSSFINNVSYLSRVHLVPSPVDMGAALHFLIQPRTVVASVIECFAENLPGLGGLKDAIVEVAAGLRSSEKPATTLERVEGYVLYLWYRRQGSRKLTFSRRSLSDAPPLMYTFKLVARFVGEVQTSWQLQKDGGLVGGLFTDHSEMEVVAKLDPTGIPHKGLCRLNCFASPRAPPDVHSVQEEKQVRCGSPLKKISAAHRRSTRTVEVLFSQSLADEDKDLVRSITTLKSLVTKLGYTGSRHGDYLERLTSSGPADVSFLLSGKSQATIESTTDLESLATRFVLKALSKTEKDNVFVTSNLEDSEDETDDTSEED